MPNLALLGHVAGQPGPMGVVATVVRAPSSADDTLDVEWTIAGAIGDEADTEHGLRWWGRGPLPVAGDDALMFTDSQGDAWAAVWPSGATEADTVETPIPVATFTNSWANFDADRPASYYKDRGRVYLTGVIKSGTIGQPAFTLLPGYRPLVGGTSLLAFAVPSNSMYGEVHVYADGRVIPQNGSNVYVGLEINFRAA